MSSINGIWGNSTSYLFGSSSTSGSSGGNILGIDLGEYYSITKGTYSKLLKAYYKKYGTEKSNSNSETKKKEDTTTTKTTLKTNANNLYKAASALVTTGKDSVFNKVDIKDEESGTTTQGYDTDKIYKAVSSLVDSYNSLVKNSTDSNNNTVLRQTLYMLNAANSNSSLLNDIGIKIKDDNTLSIDEETFKAADMTTVKTLFNGAGSLGAKIQSAASIIYMNVNDSFGNSNTYTSSGNFGNYSTGNILDSFL